MRAGADRVRHGGDGVAGVRRTRTAVTVVGVVDTWGVAGHRQETRERGVRFRLYPDDSQRLVLEGQGHGCRALWNALHEWARMAFENRRFDLKAADAAVRQARKDIPWLKAVPAQAAQQVLKAYVQANRNFWGGTHEAPVFKRRSGWHGIDIPQARDLKIVTESRKWSSLNVPLAGRIRFRQHRAIAGQITGARIIGEPDGKWFLVLRTKKTARAVNPGKATRRPCVGIDRGVAVPLALSDGTTFRHDPWLSAGEAQRLLRLERTAARQRDARHTDKRTRIGANERDTYDKIAGLHARARRRRTDWLHRTSHAIAERYSFVGIEALTIAGMTTSPAPKPDPELPGNYLPNGAAAKAGLARAILGEAWGGFADLLGYKTKDAGGTQIRVPAPYTSLTCHKCRTVTDGSRESQSRFVCKHPGCGWQGNADLNAARNIEMDMLAALAGTIGEPVTVHSSALGEGLVLVPAGGTPVAARSADSDADPRPRRRRGRGGARKGKEAGTNHGEPVHPTQQSAAVA